LCPIRGSSWQFAICEEMALPRGLHVPCDTKNLACPTDQNRAIENTKAFRALSNRVDPPPERETAAPVGAGNGGNKHENLGGAFKDRTYRALPLRAIACRYPFVVSRSHFILDALEGGRWRLTIRRMGIEAVEIFDNAAEAQRRRLRLSDEGVIGLVLGRLA